LDAPQPLATINVNEPEAPRLTSTEPNNDNLVSDNETLTSAGPRSDHLLASPSLLAESLFQCWVAPREAADSLLRIYADLYLFTAGSQSQANSAFSTASPDDVVKIAQRQSKRLFNLIHVLIA
jgi:hypothetical protein